MNDRELRDETRVAGEDEPRGQGLHVLDLAALVVGYGFAALAVRALWPAGVASRAPVLVVLAGVYAWLGLAMSGPFVLLRRPGRAGTEHPDTSRQPRRARVGQPLELDLAPEPPRYTRAETAWLLIGSYWIAVAVLVIPTRIPTRGAPILGVLPILVVGLLWFLGPGRSAATPRKPSWTDRTAVALLWSWPVAWIGLILLSLTYG